MPFWNEDDTAANDDIRQGTTNALLTGSKTRQQVRTTLAKDILFPMDEFNERR